MKIIYLRELNAASGLTKSKTFTSEKNNVIVILKKKLKRVCKRKLFSFL